jgi:DUF971 family protein
VPRVPLVNDRYEPRVITKSDPTRLTLAWADGHTTVFGARELRQMCPCAGCVDELSGRRTLDVEGVPADIVTKGVTLVGNYGLGILFSDGHGTGIYTFRMLRDEDPGG